jgi:prepilin-type N-terminal cleavage/methylation domain-containing protein
MTEAGKAKAMKGVIKKMLYVRCKNRGFTLVELLTVLAIITMLVGLLVPSLNMVRRIAKETKQKAQLASVEGALTTFRNDYGDYPPSDAWDYVLDEPLPYCGAQKLAEALLGWDLMGFHPRSTWTADGGGPPVYDPPKTRDVDGDGIADTLYERRGRYLELEAANAFRLGGPEGLFTNLGPLEPATFVLCDVFGGVKRIRMGGKTYKAGSPILYYRAKTSSRALDGATAASERIYDHHDNLDIIGAADWADDNILNHPLREMAFFYGTAGPPPILGYIQDPKVATPWPYRPDSYLLITAGADGIYGTGDDICNFGN